MDFGVFDHLDRASLPLRDYYEARLKLIEAYDRAGFHAYHLAEHHATPLGMAPSPSVFLAAAAQRTKKLRLGTMVYALPLHHPLRLVEEICMLDHLSGGRIDMGFGRGSSPIELEYYGQDPEDAPRVYAEALEVVLRGFQEKTLTAATRTHSFNDVPMELAPLQQPHPPLWYGVHSPESAERAARMGSNIACNEPAEASAALHRALLVGLARAPGRPRAAAESRRHAFRRRCRATTTRPSPLRAAPIWSGTRASITCSSATAGWRRSAAAKRTSTSWRRAARASREHPRRSSGSCRSVSAGPAPTIASTGSRSAT